MARSPEWIGFHYEYVTETDRRICNRFSPEIFRMLELWFSFRPQSRSFQDFWSGFFKTDLECPCGDDGAPLSVCSYHCRFWEASVGFRFIFVMESNPFWRAGHIYSCLALANHSNSMLSRLLRQISRGKCPRTLKTVHCSRRTITFVTNLARQPGHFGWYIFHNDHHFIITDNHLKITIFIYQTIYIFEIYIRSLH